jgi:hypothetical protein
MTGRHDVKRVEIDDSLLKEDKEMLEDLIAAAVNDAVRKVEAFSQRQDGRRNPRAQFAARNEAAVLICQHTEKIIMRKIVVWPCASACRRLWRPPVLRKSNRDGRYVEYQGELTLSGRFERLQDSITLDWRGDRVCFFPEAAQAKLLPRVLPPTSLPCSVSTIRARPSVFGLPPQPPGRGVWHDRNGHGGISRYVVENGMGETYDLGHAWSRRKICRP